MKLTKGLWFLSAGAAAAILTGLAILMIWDWLKDLTEWSSEINWGERDASAWENCGPEFAEMAAYQCGDDLPCPHCGNGACR